MLDHRFAVDLNQRLARQTAGTVTGGYDDSYAGLAQSRLLFDHEWIKRFYQIVDRLDLLQKRLELVEG
jgi:hypothetical protein